MVFSSDFALITYMGWWQKSLSIQIPITIRRTGAHPIAELLAVMSSSLLRKEHNRKPVFAIYMNETRSLLDKQHEGWLELVSRSTCNPGLEDTLSQKLPSHYYLISCILQTKNCDTSCSSP